MAGEHVRVDDPLDVGSCQCWTAIDDPDVLLDSTLIEIQPASDQSLEGRQRDRSLKQASTHRIGPGS